jgi:hypothetical protein
MQFVPERPYLFTRQFIETPPSGIAAEDLSCLALSLFCPLHCFYHTAGNGNVKTEAHNKIQGQRVMGIGSGSSLTLAT